MNVICGLCRHLRIEPYGNWKKRYTCLHPKNLKIKITWLLREASPHRHPKRINKNNDCAWFAPVEKKQDD